MNNKWYVYKLIDPRNDEIFYIGKGQKYRMYNHHYDVKKGKSPNNNYQLFRKIRDIIKDGYEIKYKKVYTTNNEIDAYDYERKLIEEIGIDNLCNLFEGRGGTYSGKKHWNYGNHWDDDVKDKIRKSKMGDKHTEEHKKMMKDLMTGEGNPMYGKNHTKHSRKKMKDNHADFNGEKNPFYGKNHTLEVKQYFKELYAKTWEVVLPTGESNMLKGKKEVIAFINEYNKINNTKVSGHSLFQYGKNGDGWTIREKNRRGGK